MNGTVKSVALATAISALAAPAVAGNVGTVPPDPVIAPAPPVYAGPDWTGFYAGGQLGYANVDGNFPLVSGDGPVYGLHAGADYDFGTWVIGAGIDYDFADFSITPINKLESLMRLKVRGGYKIGNGLLYATGGYALADVSLAGDDEGYFIGMGYEHLITPNFSVGGELNYHDFDTFRGSPVNLDITTFQIRATYRF